MLPLQNLQVAPPPIVAPYVPFPQFGPLPLDEAINGIGLAQALTREKKAQGRLLWIDATANLERVNTAAKIRALVQKAKSVGFNTLVFDVKPIIGKTLYPSAFAPKLVKWVRPWKTTELPENFDPLAVMATETKAAKLNLIVSLNAFSEGHREFPSDGPGWQNPAWQSVLYEVETRVRANGEEESSYLVADRPNTPPRQPDDLSLYTDVAKLPKLSPGSAAALISSGGAVLALYDGSQLASVLPVAWPVGAAVLVGGSEASGRFLREKALPGTTLELLTRPVFVRTGERPELQTPLMTSPHNPDVRARLNNIVREVLTKYPIDGVIFDDRLRYASLNADFSEIARAQFEAWLKKPVRWPDDIFRWDVVFPSLARRPVPGPYFEAWLTFRALTLRNALAEVRATVDSARPGATLATYVGSWYPDYSDLGANWASDDLQAGFRFLNDSYRATGWAGLTDFITTGCYYPTPTINDALIRGVPIGNTVEAAGQLSNRAVNDRAFVYAGISLERFKNKPDELKKVLQAACASTQGVMCFDLSHDIEPLWPVFAEAFQTPAVAPHASPELKAELARRRAAKKASGAVDPPVIIHRGTSGTGF